MYLSFILISLLLKAETWTSSKNNIELKKQAGQFFKKLFGLRISFSQGRRRTKGLQNMSCDNTYINNLISILHQVFNINYVPGCSSATSFLPVCSLFPASCFALPRKAITNTETSHAFGTKADSRASSIMLVFIIVRATEENNVYKCLATL